MRTLVVGTGLIGGSIGLALRRAGTVVLLADAESDQAEIAASLGAGDVYRGGPVDLVVVAVPAGRIASVVVERLSAHPAAVVVDVGGVKAAVEREVLERAGPDAARYIGSHPLAGSEQSGPRAARADLFDGRRWGLVPSPRTAPAARRAALWLVRACGARPVELTADDHDRAVAVTSHLPQLVASALAGQLGGLTDAECALSGPGLRDTARLARSPAGLWEQIAVANAGPIEAALERFAATLDAVRAALAAAARHPGPAAEAALAAAVHDLIRDGAAGIRRLDAGEPPA
jgi:prephenate dehydrogenase